jgi:Fur family transcriptional regulator, ferric uptake regulator
MKSNREAEEILLEHGLKRTPIRIEMIGLFLKHSHALAHRDIEDSLNIGHDRVTIYRALDTFEKSGILHKVPDSNNEVKYGLCSDNCTADLHQDSHVHFICQKCHKTFCLKDVHVPAIKIPAEFTVKDYNFTLTGVCKKCSR